VAAVVPPAEQVVDDALKHYGGIVGILDSREGLSNRLFARGGEELRWILYTSVSQHIVNKKLVLH